MFCIVVFSPPSSFSYGPRTIVSASGGGGVRGVSRRRYAVCMQVTMERHFAALSPRRCNGPVAAHGRAQPLGPDGAVEPPARRGEAGAEWDSHSGSAMVTRPVPRPRAARHHDRGPKGPETRSSVGPTVGPRGGWRNRAARTGDGRCGIRGFGPTRIGRHRSGPHWTRHEPSAGTCAAIRSEDGAMHHHLHHHHSVLDGAVYSTKGSKALRSS